MITTPPEATAAKVVLWKVLKTYAMKVFYQALTEGREVTAAAQFVQIMMVKSFLLSNIKMTFWSIAVDACLDLCAANKR